MKKNNHRKARRQRVSKPLTSPSAKKTSAWAKGGSIATSLVASCAIVYGAATSMPANAISIPSVGTLVGMVKSVLQVDAITSALQVNTAQTAYSGVHISNQTIESEFNKAAVLTGEARGKKIVDLVMESKPGIGVSNHFTCIPQAERTTAVSKEIMSRRSTESQMMTAASGYAETTADKRGKRAYDHLNFFCDSTEVAQGLCIPRPNGLGGADSNYSTIANNSLLTEETEQAAYAFMLNVTDPSSTDYDTCDSIACDSIETTNRVYKALSSMSQNAFLNQINDAKVLEFSEEQKKEDDSVQYNGLPEVCIVFIEQVKLASQKHPDATLGFAALAEEIRTSYGEYSEADKEQAREACKVKTEELAEVIKQKDKEREESIANAAKESGEGKKEDGEATKKP